MTLKECICLIHEDLEMYPNNGFLGGRNVFLLMHRSSLPFGYVLGIG